MSLREHERNDPDDFFKDTRMPLGNHIEELRLALWRALKGFFVAVLVGFLVADRVLNFISSPVERELMHFYNNRVQKKKEQLEKEMKAGKGKLADLNQPREIVAELSRAELRRQITTLLGLDLAQLGQGGGSEDMGTVSLTLLLRPVGIALVLDEALRVVGRPPALSALGIAESFVIWVKVGLYTGLVLSSPWIFWQIWMFIAAGLYPSEKRLVHYYLPISLGLFLGGVLLCEFLVLPAGIRYLLSFNEWLNVEPDLRLSEWLSFALLMPVIFGMAFQLPLVMFFLERIGLVTSGTYLAYWRVALFVLLILAGLLQVSADPFSMLALAVPLCLLYGLGILLCKLSPKPGVN